MNTQNLTNNLRLTLSQKESTHDAIHDKIHIKNFGLHCPYSCGVCSFLHDIQQYGIWNEPLTIEDKL